jgi:hypothetical protein
MTSEYIGAPSVGEELIGRLHTGRTRDVDQQVAGLSDDIRANLAVFCYSRAHLHDAALAIAATCELETLEVAGGSAGGHLFARSRERPKPNEAAVGSRRARVSLATSASRLSLANELRLAAGTEGR